MSTPGLLVAAGLMVLMLGTLSFLQKNTPGTERALRESKRMTLLPVRDGDRIELQTAKGKFLFQKDKGAEWRILSPVETGADGNTIGQLLSEVQFVELMQTFPSEAKTEANLQTFGLGRPSRTLKVATPEGELVVEIGRETPRPGGVYVRVRQPGSGEQLMVVQNQLVEAMDKELAAWREKRVFPLVVPEVTGWWMRQGALEVEVQKNPEGRWTVRRPVEAPADPAAVDAVLGEISALKALDFVADSEGELALYGLTAPAQSFEVKTASTNRILQVGLVDPKNTNQIFAKMADRPSVFTLARSSLDSLGKLPDRIRDRRLVTFPSPDGVTRLDFSGKGGDYRLEKEGEHWKLTWGENSRRADPKRVSRWLEALFQARANRFLATEDPAKLGFSRPRLSVVISWKDASPAGAQTKNETLLFGEEAKEEAYIQNSAISGTMATPVALARETPDGVAGWFERRFLPGDFGSVRGVIWTGGGQRREYRRGAEGGWVQNPGGEAPAVAGYAARVEGLEVLRWTAFSGKKDAFRPEMELVLEGDGGKKTRFSVGRPSADGSVPLLREGDSFLGWIGRGAGEWLRKDPGLPYSPAAAAPSGG